jgi:branched-chain amino acid transport system substrate-binding protein
MRATSKIVRSRVYSDPLKLFKIPILLALMLLGQPVCAQTLRLGALLDLSSSDEGRAYLRGLELAVEQEQGQVELFAEDSGGGSKRAEAATETLISSGLVGALFLMSIEQQLSAHPIARKYEVLTINIAESSPRIEKLGELGFGFGLWEPATAERGAVFAFEDLKARTAAVVCQYDNWSDRICKEFTEWFQKLGGRIVIGQSLNPEQLDFRTVIHRIEAAKPALLFLPLKKNAAEFLKQLRQQHPSLNIRLLTAQAFSPEELKLIEGYMLYQIQPVLKQNDRLNKLLERYRARYKEDCHHPLQVAWGYDAGRLVIEGWKRNQFQTGKSLASAIRKLRMYPGASGLINLNDRGTAAKYPGVLRAHNGSVTELTIGRY